MSLALNNWALVVCTTDHCKGVVLVLFVLCMALRLLHSELFLFLPHLRKRVYSNLLKILPPKNENFQIKNSDMLHISAQNIDCGIR